MALSAAFARDDGTPNEPGMDSPWDGWVAASKTRNYCCDDPLLDWLTAHGAANGFTPDDQDPRTDFRTFIFEKAARFEDAAMRCLAARCQLVTIRKQRPDVHDRACVEATWRAMCDGVEIISQGVLWNPQTQTYGAPDLLIRSDVLQRLFPCCLAEEDARQGAPDLPLRDLHYRVVDVKFTTLDLLKDGHAGGGHLEYMAQVWLYNEALGRLQGFTPPAAFLLGRRWKDSKGRGQSAFDRLARVDHGRHFNNMACDLREVALRSCEWIRRVRSHGAEWRLLPQPSVPELWPNMRHGDDQPWHRAKAEAARQLDDLTLLPRVTPDRRELAFAAGLARWTDPRCSAALLGVTGEKLTAVLDAVIRANHSDGVEAVVFPSRVTANELLWREPAVPEFYVDFETVSDLDDDFARFPEPGGQPLIFMIGCGQITGPAEAPRWEHRTFTARALTLAEERRVIDAWIAHMRDVCDQAGVSLERARLFHWSPAETSFLTDAYNAAVVRHQADWPDLPWVDLLGRVVKEQPVTVRGAFGFGLKAVARALHSHGLIETLWPDGPTDGLGAMVGAWWCHGEAQRLKISMTDLELMKEIERYNEVDCRVMAEALTYLRRHR